MPELTTSISLARATREDAAAQGYRKAYRGVSKASPVNESGTIWLTSSWEVAKAYAEEVFTYDDPAVAEIWYDARAVPTYNMRRISDEEREALDPDEFGNPQAPGIYLNADDSPLGSYCSHTVIHVPKTAVLLVDDGGATFDAIALPTAGAAQASSTEAPSTAADGYLPGNYPESELVRKLKAHSPETIAEQWARQIEETLVHAGEYRSGGLIFSGCGDDRYIEITTTGGGYVGAVANAQKALRQALVGMFSEDEGLLNDVRRELRENPAQAQQLNSEGRPIHPAEEAIARFWAWFGRSAVVDSRGAPLVVFKGMPAQDWRTGAEIEEIRSANGPWAGFFSSCRATASRFTTAFGEGAVLIPAYLRMERPFIVDAMGGHARDFMFDSISGRHDSALTAEAIRSPAYDGVIIRNTADEGDVFVPKRPEQIKSAIGNDGWFAPDDPRIVGDPSRALLLPAPSASPIRRRSPTLGM